MFKITVLYPHSDGALFDHEYYRDKHMPLLRSLVGDACIRYEIDRGLAGGEPGQVAPFVAMCHVFVTSIEAFQTAIAEHAPTIIADLVKYTDIRPVMQFSEVTV